jgi:uncharacterized protein (TIGR02996 family)
VTDDAFLRSVIDNPDDDTPRLAYADWLEEHGDPERAEFIRVQVEYERLPEDDDRRDDLEDHWRSLLARHEEDWAGLHEVLTYRREFRRGFLAAISLLAAELLEYAEHIFAAAPLEEVAVSEARRWTPQLAACPYLGLLSGLRLGDVPNRNERSGSGGLRDLLASPHLGRLRRLGLDGSLVDLDGLISLVGSPLFRRLTELDLCGSDLDNRAARVVAASPASRGLEVLSLGGTGVSAAGVAALAASPHLAGLTNLDLGGLMVGDEGCEALASSPYLRGLRRLGLSVSHVGTNGVVALAASPNVGRLTRLDLDGNGVGDAGVAALAASPHLVRLRHLALQGSRVGVNGVRALVDSGTLSGLRTLVLTSPRLGAEVVEALTTPRALPSLRSLMLGRLQDGNESVRVLAAAPWVSRLKSLELLQYGQARDPITDEGARALLASPYLGGLRWLSLGGTSISEPMKEKLRGRFGESVCDIW